MLTSIITVFHWNFSSIRSKKVPNILFKSSFNPEKDKNLLTRINKLNAATNSSFTENDLRDKSFYSVWCKHFLSNKDKTFFIKYLHNILLFGDQLNKIDPLKFSRSCTPCNNNGIINPPDETIYHLITQCVTMAPIIAFFVNALKILDINYTPANILIGSENPDPTLRDFLNLNAFFLIACTSQLARSSVPITVQLFKRFLSARWYNTRISAKFEKSTKHFILQIPPEQAWFQ